MLIWSSDERIILFTNSHSHSRIDIGIILTKFSNAKRNCIYQEVCNQNTKYCTVNHSNNQLCPSKQPCWKVFITALADGVQISWIPVWNAFLLASLNVVFSFNLNIASIFSFWTITHVLFQKKVDHSHQILSNSSKILSGGKTCSNAEEHPLPFILKKKMLGLKLHS